MKRIIANQHQQVATWVAAGVPMMELGEAPYTTIGLIDSRGYLQAGIVYNTFTGSDIVLSIRLLNRKSITRRFIVEGFRYPFQQLNCNRCTVMVARRNKPSQRFVKKLGWKYEGTLREWYPDGQDAIVFGMLRRECRWLNVHRRRTDGSVLTRHTGQPGDAPGPGSAADQHRDDAPPDADVRRGSATLPRVTAPAGGPALDHPGLNGSKPHGRRRNGANARRPDPA